MSFHLIVQQGEVFLAATDYPIGHRLPRQIHTISLKLTFMASQGDRVNILSIHDNRHDRGVSYTTTKQRWIFFSTKDIPAATVFTSIDGYHMLFSFKVSRHKTQITGFFFGDDFQGFSTVTNTFFSRKFMFYACHRKISQICFSFAFLLLTLIGLWNDFLILRQTLGIRRGSWDKGFPELTLQHSSYFSGRNFAFSSSQTGNSRVINSFLMCQKTANNT